MDTRPMFILVIDGCAPEYIEHADLPNLKALIRRGFYRRVRAVVPTVTNVNHASILTGAFPEKHGVASNYWYDRANDSGGWIESPEHVRAPTYVEKVRMSGGRSLFLSAKGKLQTLLGANADIAISSEMVPSRWSELLPEPPPLTDPQNSYWLIDVARRLLNIERPDFVYVTTTDYLMHHHAPEDDQAMTHMALIDRAMGELLDQSPEFEVYITAYHGMNSKDKAINLQLYLEKNGYSSRVILPLEDRYTENHPLEESGSAYIYLLGDQPIEGVMSCIKNLSGVEEVLTSKEASNRYRLPHDLIGDLVVHAEREFVFGSHRKMDSIQMPSKVRSHGSLYEREIPLIAFNSRHNKSDIEYSLDILRTDS